MNVEYLSKRAVEKVDLWFFPFVLLRVILCDPLWFNELYFTTKVH